MKSILLPTDFSSSSVNAIFYAIELFKDVRCEFYILNVQKASSFVSDDLMTMQPSTTIYQNLISSAKKGVEKIISEIKKKYDDVPWDEMYLARNKISHEYFGIDYELIWEIAKNNLPQNRIDLIEIIKKEKKY